METSLLLCMMVVVLTLPTHQGQPPTARTTYQQVRRGLWSLLRKMMTLRELWQVMPASRCKLRLREIPIMRRPTTRTAVLIKSHPRFISIDVPICQALTANPVPIMSPFRKALSAILFQSRYKMHTPHWGRGCIQLLYQRVMAWSQ